MAIDREPQAESVEVLLANEEATLTLARVLATALRAGDVIFLIGDLGTGKTVLARGVINALAPTDDHITGAAGETSEEEVPSPTFTLVQIYDRRPAPVWHVDLYRLERPEDVEELGLEEAAEAITLIEWPERLGERVPPDRLDVRLDYGPHEDARHAEITGHGAWRSRLEALDLEGAEAGDSH